MRHHTDRAAHVAGFTFLSPGVPSMRYPRRPTRTRVVWHTLRTEFVEGRGMLALMWLAVLVVYFTR